MNYCLHFPAAEFHFTGIVIMRTELAATAFKMPLYSGSSLMFSLQEFLTKILRRQNFGKQEHPVSSAEPLYAATKASSFTKASEDRSKQAFMGIKVCFYPLGVFLNSDSAIQEQTFSALKSLPVQFYSCGIRQWITAAACCLI